MKDKAFLSEINIRTVVLLFGFAICFIMRNSRIDVRAETLLYNDMEYGKDFSPDKMQKYLDDERGYGHNDEMDIADLSGYLRSVDTRNQQDYQVASDPVTAYLAAEDNGYMAVRINYINYFGLHEESEIEARNILIEYFDQQFHERLKKYIPMELKKFGGFYSGKDFNFIVFGQNNLSEDDSIEVMRVVKYNKNWDRIAAVSVYGANTYIPFEAGSLRMTESRGVLYVRTCHEMYAKADKLHHQANMTISVNMENMSIVESNHEVRSYKTGYVSHSFNQYIITDDQNNLIALDHGDGYPRAAVLSKWSEQESGEKVILHKYMGATGNNWTKATIGGLEYSNTDYLTAGNSIMQDINYESRATRNIYITSTKRTDVSEGGTLFRWITDYEEGAELSPTTPHLVKISDNMFLLIWELLSDINDYGTGKQTGRLEYVFLDGEGNNIGGKHYAEGYLSQCKPIVNDGMVVWYTLEEGRMFFYTLDLNGNLQSHSITPKLNSIENTGSTVRLTWEKVPGASSYVVLRKTQWVWEIAGVTDQTQYTDKLTKDGKYTYTFRPLDSQEQYLFEEYDFAGLTIWYEKGKTDENEDNTDDEYTEDNNSDENVDSDTKDKDQNEIAAVPSKGAKLTDKKTNAVYKVTKSGTAGGKVSYLKPLSRNVVKAIVPASVKINGISYKVTAISADAFKNHKKLKSVSIGYNVLSIGKNAFYGCIRLKNVSMGGNINTIGERAFYKCTALPRIVIPEKVSKIGKQAFYGDKKLASISIQTKKLTNSKVGSDAFDGIGSHAVYTVPRVKMEAYKKLLIAKGADL